MEVQEAFDTLLDELRRALKEAQQAGAEALRRSDFSAVRATAEKGEAIQRQIAHLESLRREWIKLIGKRAPGRVTGEGRRAAPGEAIPRQAYRLPILQALGELGGRGEVALVLERVYQIMEDQLTEIDKERLPSGHDFRWRNSAQWERLRMVKEGLLASNSPRGIWEITEKGWELLRGHQDTEYGDTQFDRLPEEGDP